MERMRDSAVVAACLLAGIALYLCVVGRIDMRKARQAHDRAGRIVHAQGNELDRLRKRLLESERELEQVQRSTVSNHFRLVGMGGTVEGKELAKLAKTSRRLDRLQKDISALHDRVKELRWAVEIMAKNIPGRARPPRYRWKDRPK